MKTPTRREIADPPCSDAAIRALRHLAPLEECILDSHRPEARSTVILGSVPGRNPEYGAWGLAELEKSQLVSRLGRMEIFTDPNRCILHSEDYRLQMTIRVPPGKGRLDFNTVWYPPDLPFAGAFRISLISAGKGGARAFISEYEWPERARGCEFLVLKPSLSLQELDYADLFALYATPLGTYAGVPGEGHGYNSFRP
jgi:hypothetical protein